MGGFPRQQQCRLAGLNLLPFYRQAPLSRCLAVSLSRFPPALRTPLCLDAPFGVTANLASILSLSSVVDLAEGWLRFHFPPPLHPRLFFPLHRLRRRHCHLILHPCPCHTQILYTDPDTKRRYTNTFSKTCRTRRSAVRRCSRLRWCWWLPCLADPSHS